MDKLTTVSDEPRVLGIGAKMFSLRNYHTALKERIKRLVTYFGLYQQLIVVSSMKRIGTSSLHQSTTRFAN